MGEGLFSFNISSEPIRKSATECIIYKLSPVTPCTRPQYTFINSNEAAHVNNETAPFLLTSYKNDAGRFFFLYIITYYLYLWVFDHFNVIVPNSSFKCIPVSATIKPFPLFENTHSIWLFQFFTKHKSYLMHIINEYYVK